jgi:hypothetical protein
MTSTINLVKRIHGPVARLGVPSEDGRQLDPAGAMLPTEPVPIMALPPRREPRPDHGGAVLVGRGRFLIRGGLLLVDGRLADVQLRVPAGRYACGLDMRFADGDMEVVDGVMVFHSWVPIGVTLHLGGPGGNAFAGLDLLEVTES